MSTALRSPNRTLDLDEMETPEFLGPIGIMETLAAREEISYLHPSKRWEYPWALQRAELRRGARVLDAGCGASIFPVYLAQAGMHTSACDLEIPVGLGELHGVAIDYRRADLLHLPFETAEFDAVFCISVIEHLPRDAAQAALQELGRVLRPGGRLLLTTDYYYDAKAELWYEDAQERFRVDWNVFDEALLRALILNADGFDVEGETDLMVDWTRSAARMRRFHGYPYTSVGICLKKR